MRQSVIWWVRRDLRLEDNAALQGALASGLPVLPVFICDDCVETLGAAPRWRLGLGVAALQAGLEAKGLRLVLRRGPALAVLRDLVAETGAVAVHWGRLYDPQSLARDVGVKAGLRALGVRAHSHTGHLIHQPWEVAPAAGGFYRVFTPFWRAVRGREEAACLPMPTMRGPMVPEAEVWPRSDNLASWNMAAGMGRGADIVGRHVRVGAVAAVERLAAFVDGRLEEYKTARDFPGLAATSGLSENLTYGEISPRMVWHAGMRALAEGRSGAEHFLMELTWREFAYHLVYHTPWIAERCWKAGWEAFPWAKGGAQLQAWKRGRTGVQIVDAAMRQMYVTGVMHNRARMIAASYLTKHLLTDWRAGMAWFEQCLIDWDPAANALGWQWVAGCGPDAAPYFRVFNPDGQAEKFDGNGNYRRRFVAELTDAPGPEALDYFAAIPRAWKLGADQPYPVPIVGMAEGRAAALGAYAGAMTKLRQENLDAAPSV